MNTANYTPSPTEIQTALRARQGLKALFRSGHLDRLEPEYRKALSSFGFGNSGFLLAPEMSNRVLSCLVDPTDLSGLMDSIAISGPSIRFLIDNARTFLAAWACEAGCFANNPQPDLQEGLGEMDIKPETIRFVVCVTRVLEDASIDVEAWILRKASEGMAATINAASLHSCRQAMTCAAMTDEKPQLCDSGHCRSAESARASRTIWEWSRGRLAIGETGRPRCATCTDGKASCSPSTSIWGNGRAAGGASTGRAVQLAGR